MSYDKEAEVTEVKLS